MMTNNEYLSQEEIDALLNQDSDSIDNDSASDNGTSEPSHIDDLLTTIEQDALGEIGNITFGTAATALSTLLGKKVEITTPSVSFVKKENMEDEFPKPHVSVHVKYVEGFQGINSLVIKVSDAQVIADLMLGGDGTGLTGDEFNEIHISAVQEAMNQMMGSSATSMSTIFERFVNISPPSIDILNLSEGISNLPDEDIFIKVSFRITIGDLIDSTLMQLLPVDFAKEMVKGLLGSNEDEAQEEEQLEINEPMLEQAAQQGNLVTDEELSSLLAGQEEVAQAPTPPQQPAQQQFAMPNIPMPTPSSPQRNIDVQPVQYTNLAGSPLPTAGDVNLNLLLDIPLRVTVELGRTKRLIKDILEFSQGSIIELDKLAGEPVDILANDKLIAKGEVVVIDENFGVRVTEIVSQAERLKNLG